MAAEDEAIAALAHQLLQLRTGRQIIAFRKRLTKEQAQAVIKHPLIGPVDRAAIILAIQFNGDTQNRRSYNFSTDWGFGDSLITTNEDLSHATQAPSQDDRRIT
jgi:hypothetical protein